jgi:deoxyribose-phosphate aldolase
MTADKISAARMAAIIDHTFLKAFGPPGDIETLCNQAIQYGFVAVCVHPSEVKAAADLLAGHPTLVATVIGFPLGQNQPAVKEYEARDAIQLGAREIDMVINLRALQAGNQVLVGEEIAGVVKACAEGNARCKVIIETCYLTDAQKIAACQIASGAGADFVKTSTGFGTSGATPEDVRLMKSHIRPEMGVKASGGIRDLKSALAMIEAGASRLGTSSGVAIVTALQPEK